MSEVKVPALEHIYMYRIRHHSYIRPDPASDNIQQPSDLTNCSEIRSTANALGNIALIITTPQTPTLFAQIGPIALHHISFQQSKLDLLCKLISTTWLTARTSRPARSPSWSCPMARTPRSRHRHCLCLTTSMPKAGLWQDSALKATSSVSAPPSRSLSVLRFKH